MCSLFQNKLKSGKVGRAIDQNAFTKTSITLLAQNERYLKGNSHQMFKL